MKKTILALAATVLMLAAPVLAAPKPCDELKSEIEEKIKKNGVQDFTLEVVAKTETAPADGKVVGTCDGGTKQIVYKRGR